MGSLAEFRQQNPDYNDMSDTQLADALHRKFYSDMPRTEFNSKIGFVPEQSKPTDTKQAVNAFTGGFIRDLPIVGPTIESGAQKAAAGIRSLIHGTPYQDELKAVGDYAKGAAENNPGLTMAGGVAGNITALAPVGMTAIGARALGITGPSAFARIGTGAVTGAGIGAADTAVRGGDIPTGTMIGAAGGAIGPALGAAASRLISPLRTPPERQALVNILERENVPMTAGDSTGNRPLRWMETSLGDLPGAGSAISGAKEEQGQAFTRAALRRAGEAADLATPDVMQTAATRIGNDFNTLSARNTLQYDRQFAQDVANTVGAYDRTLNSQQRQVFHNYVQDIVSQPNGQMAGDMYQIARSRLSRQANNLYKSNSDVQLADALTGLRDALDNGMRRSISPADAAAWDTARAQWGNMRTIEKAMGGAGERTAEGYLSPQQLRTAVKMRNPSAYVRGHGDLAELARAGAGVLQPMPNSGTAPRAYMQHLATAALPAIGGGGAGYAAGGPEGAIAGALAPGLLARALLSGPGRAYFANQAAGPRTQAALARALMGPSREGALAVSEDEKRRRGQISNR
jgi:hypothetical protein